MYFELARRGNLHELLDTFQVVLPALPVLSQRRQDLGWAHIASSNMSRWVSTMFQHTKAWFTKTPDESKVVHADTINLHTCQQAAEHIALQSCSHVFRGPLGNAQAPDCVITLAKARASGEDHVPLFAIVWVHYTILENLDCVQCPNTIMRSKVRWSTPVFSRVEVGQ